MNGVSIHILSLIVAIARIIIKDRVRRWRIANVFKKIHTKSNDQKEHDLAEGVYAVTFTAVVTTNQHF